MSRKLALSDGVYRLRESFAIGRVAIDVVWRQRRNGEVDASLVGSRRSLIATGQRLDLIRSR